MVNIQDVPANDLIDMTAAELKNFDKIKAPEWALYVKTGMHKERPPVREDWWHVRAAAVLRTVSKLGPIGVSKLRTKYGGKKNRGHKPGRFYKGSGNILRKVLQQLEASELIKKAEKGAHKGRVLTPKGQSLLSKMAFEVSKNMPTKPEIKKAEKAPEAKPAKADKQSEKAPVKEATETKNVETKAEKTQVKEKPEAKPVPKETEKKTAEEKPPIEEKSEDTSKK